MGLLRTRKPNVKALARLKNVAGLVQAAGYRESSGDLDDGGSDPGASVREEAVLALGALGPEAGNGTVSGALSDPSERVRVAAVRVLYSRGEASELAEALKWLHADAPARRLAVQAVLTLHEPGCARTVAGALARADGGTPIHQEDVALLHTLMRSEESPDVTTEVVEELLSALADHRETVTERAEELLWRLAPSCTEGLIAELQGGAVPHRAAVVLGRIGDARAMEPLIEALKHPDPDVRGESATALGELRDTAAVEPLLLATRDSDHYVRSCAGDALDQLGTAGLVVGVATMGRPAIAEALAAGGDQRAELPEPPAAAPRLSSFRAALDEARG